MCNYYFIKKIYTIIKYTGHRCTNINLYLWPKKIRINKTKGNCRILLQYLAKLLLKCGATQAGCNNLSLRIN